VSAQRTALIVANDEYEHEGLGRLLAPAADAQALAAVLGAAEIGDFDVRVVSNEAAHVIQAQVEELFSEARPDDLLLLHFSCHGLKNESGELFFAAANTRPNRLASTAVSADFVQRCMRASRSRSIVLLLDCCYGGAFARGVTVRASGDADVLSSFPREQARSGRGRAVITASSAMEYAFEGDQLAGDAGSRPSVFTSALVEGLVTGDADRDQDGWVSLDELYDYVFDQVRERNPHQTPSRDVEMQGDLLIARRSRPVTTPAPLPPELRLAVDSPLAGVRAGVVQELARVLRGGHVGLALAARLALEDLADDDSRQVAAAAAAVLRPAAPSPPPSAPAATAAPLATPGLTADPLATPALPATSDLPATPDLSATSAASATFDLPATPDPLATADPLATPAPAATPEPAPATQPAPATLSQPAAATADPRLRVAGVLAVAEAILLAIVPFVTFTDASSYRLISYAANRQQLFIDAAVVLAAGICLLVPRTSALIGTGLMLGAAAVVPSDVAIVFGVLRVNGPIQLGPGSWLVLIAEALAITAAVLAGLSLGRGRAVRLEPRSLLGQGQGRGRGRGPGQFAAGLVAALGLAGAVAYAIQVGRAHQVPGLAVAVSSQLVIPLAWTTIVAVAVPLIAVAARPRTFGTALAGGWICAGLGEASFLTGFKTGVFAFILVALALALIPFARTAPPGEGAV
jgi:Caspase domain